MFGQFITQRRSTFAAVAFASIFALAPLNGSFAQDASTPTPPEIIPGSECVTEARDYNFLSEIFATPVAVEEYVAPTSVPDGEALDKETETEIRAAVRQFIACSNSGEVLRALSLLDDEYLRRIFDPSGEIDVDTANELLETLATPTAIAEDQLVIFIGILEMVKLPDGTVAVVLETDGGLPNDEGTDVDLFIFTKVDDTWLVIDAVNDIDDIEAGIAE